MDAQHLEAPGSSPKVPARALGRSNARRVALLAAVLTPFLASACGKANRSCVETETCTPTARGGSAGSGSDPQGGTGGRGGSAGSAGTAMETGGEGGDGPAAGGKAGTAGKGNGGSAGEAAGKGGSAGSARGGSGTAGDAGMGGDGSACPPGCSAECPCDAGEGPCINASDCTGSLVCGEATGPKFGISGNACVPAHCTNDTVDGGETSQDCGGGCGCPTFEVLSDNASCAFDVNADGAYVVGTEFVGYDAATRWTSRTIHASLVGPVPNDFGRAAAWGIDATGSTVVGFMTLEATPSEYHVARWSGPTLAYEDLGMLPAGTSPTGAAHAVAADGSVVIGRSGEGINAPHQAFRSTDVGNYDLLGFVDGGSGGNDYSTAEGISADGSVIVGAASDPAGSVVPYRWTEAGGMVSLGQLQGGSSFGEASATNEDGSVVVGYIEGPNGSEAFLWEGGNMVGLGDLPGGTFGSSATDVSGDGTRVVGNGTPEAQLSEAFLWDESAGLRTLHVAMREFGYEEALDDWHFETVNAISTDGKVVVGCASGPLAPEIRVQAFRLRLEP